MLINNPEYLHDKPEDVKGDLEYLISGFELDNPVCSPDCTIYQDKDCNKNCSDVAATISSDKAYPVESGVAPLVFEMKRVSVFEPCWSCEGHLGVDGGLWKLPMVWFYTRSPVYVRILSQALNEMLYNKTISNKWGVVVTHSNTDNLSTCFSLQPERGDVPLELESLQSDLSSITGQLIYEVKKEALKLLKKIN